MQVKGVRLYAKDDIRLEEFELPEIKDDEILVKVMSDSICMSTWKMVKQGADHKRVPADVADHPIIIGHEFAGDIVKVGKKWQDKFKPGQKFAQQPAILDRLNLQDTLIQSAVEQQLTVFSQMILSKLDAFGLMKEILTLNLLLQNQCAVSFVVIKQTITLKTVMNM
mgnify:CR=1 FL=1